MARSISPKILFQRAEKKRKAIAEDGIAEVEPTASELLEWISDREREALTFTHGMASFEEMLKDDDQELLADVARMLMLRMINKRRVLKFGN